MEKMLTMVSISLIAALFVVAQSEAYPDGPPIAEPGLCRNMTPTGHMTEDGHGHDGHAGHKHDTEAPYEFVLSGNCYNGRTTLQARLRIKGKAEPSKYFERFFIQAKQDNSDSTNFGSFDTLGGSGIQTMDCFGNSDSALGHSKHAHYWARTFNWLAPDSNVGDHIHLIATVLHGETTVWRKVTSEAITFDANCNAGATLPNEAYGDIAPVDCNGHTHDSREEEFCNGASVLSASVLLLMIGAHVLKVFL